MRKIFLFAVAIIFACLSLAFSDEGSAKKMPQQKIMSSPNGRYVFSQISEYRRDQFLLDTQTGRLWQIVSEEDDSPSKLAPVPYIQIYGDEAYIPDPPSEIESHRKFIRKKTMEQFKNAAESEKSN